MHEITPTVNKSLKLNNEKTEFWAIGSCVITVLDLWDLLQFLPLTKAKAKNLGISLWPSVQPLCTNGCSFPEIFLLFRNKSFQRPSLNNNMDSRNSVLNKPSKIANRLTCFFLSKTILPIFDAQTSPIKHMFD